MPYYEYTCSCDEQKEMLRWYEMGTADRDTPGSYNGHCCLWKRVWGDFQYQEDKRRFRQGLSHTTGMPYAQSRAEEKRIEKEKGIEFIGPSEMPSQWTKLKEYSQHVKNGGDRVDPEVLNPTFMPSSKGEIMKKLVERGVVPG